MSIEEATLRTLVRQLREIRGVTEARPGVLHLRGKPFVTIAGGTAEIVKPGGSGVDRLAIDTAPGQRKLVDEAKLRAKKLDDED